MTEAIYWGRLASLVQAVAALPVTDPTFVILERVPATWMQDEERLHGLRLERLDPTTNFDLWERGRIFSPAFELRWERTGAAVQAVYCGQQTVLPGFETIESLDLSTLTTETRSYFLWGSRVKDEDLALIGQPPGTQLFVELQVPRLLRYPVTRGAQRVKLQVREYRDEFGSLAYNRFLGLEEIL